MAELERSTANSVTFAQLEVTMKKLLIIAGALAALSAAPQPAAAQPGGCIKYGLGGAIVGRLAGGHTWKGAAAGCVVGYLRRKQYRNQITQREREVLARHERQLEREQAGRRLDRDGTNPRRYDDEPSATGNIGRRSNQF